MTQLLVSVRSAEEAEAALAGGAHLIDIKEPTRGALGHADATTIADIVHVVDEIRKLTFSGTLVAAEQVGKDDPSALKIRCSGTLNGKPIEKKITKPK